jgi:hypothetical protein
MSSLSAEDASSQSKNYITTFKEYGSVIVAIGGFFGGCYTFYFLLKSDIKGDIRADVTHLDNNITNLKADMNTMSQNLKADMNTMSKNLKADMNTMSQNLKADITNLKADMNTNITNLKTDINANSTLQADRILGILAAKGDGQDKMIEGHGKMIKGHEKMIEGHEKMIESFIIKIDAWSGESK